MSDDKKPKNPSMTTEKGIFIYPHLSEPDRKFAADEEPGRFKTKYRPLNPAYGEKLKATLTAHQDAAFEEARNSAKTPAARDKIKKMDLPIDEVYDDAGNKTGQVDFKFSVREFVRLKDGKTHHNKVRAFDSKGKPTNVSIWSGTEGKITFAVSSFTNPKGEVYVTLKPLAVQVLKLIGPGQRDRDASGFGFGVEEGGFTAPDETEGDFSGSSSGGEGDDDSGAALL